MYRPVLSLSLSLTHALAIGSHRARRDGFGGTTKAGWVQSSDVANVKVYTHVGSSLTEMIEWPPYNNTI